MAKPPKAEGVSRLQLSQILACNTREVNYLADRGLVVKIGHGRYNLFQSVVNVVKHLREIAAGRAGHDGRVDPVAANAGFKQSQTRLIELRIAEVERRLIGIPDVESVWSALVIDARILIQSIPSRIRARLPGLTPTDVRIIETIVREVLEDMALGNPDKPPLEAVVSPVQQ